MTTDNDPAAILARFPGPVRLTPSPRKWLLILAGGLVFVACGIWMRNDNAVMAWLCIAFFGLGTLIAGAMLLPGAAGLVLDADGFEVTNIFRRQRTRWADVTGFTVADIPPSGQKLVVYDDARVKNSTLGKINTSLAGRDAALPDTYGLAPQALANLMAGWRERAAGPEVPAR